MWRLVRFVAAFSVLGLMITVSCLGADPIPPGQLPAMAQSAKTEFRPVTSEDVQQRKGILSGALGALEEFLQSGAARKEKGWKSYLKWDRLQQELEKDTPDLRTLQSSLLLYYAQHSGLELEQFRDVRAALRGYMDAALVSSESKFKEAYEARLDELGKRLEEYGKSPSRTDAVAIGQTLGWLERAGQAKRVVAAVRQSYWQPNLFAQISQRVIAAGFEDDVSEVETVTQIVRGTPIRGTARMTGQIHLSLVPDEQQASLSIQLRGVANSNNVGRRGPVTVYSRGVTQVQADKQVHVDADGLHLDSAVARCNTNSTITRIAARCGLIRRVAWKQARRTQPEAERVGSRNAERRVRRKFDAQAEEMLGNADEAFAEDFRNPLLRKDGFPNLLRFGTTEEHLRIEMMRAGPGQLAAPSDPPELKAGHDLAARVHDSLVGNLCETLFGGETLSDEGLVELLEQAEAEVPEELKIGPDKDPWSISFSRYQPITAEFSSDGMKLAIQGVRFTRGDQEIRRTIRISAAYRVEEANGGVRLTRQGEVEVDYPNRDRLSVAEVAMKTFLRKKFDALFEAEVVAEDLVLPGRFEQFGPLKLSQLNVAAGWLAIGWEKAPDETQVATAP